MNCPICKNKNCDTIYTIDSIPVFQNKIYNSYNEAVNAQIQPVVVKHCSICNMIFNSTFDAGYMDYDANYQNEQACSEYFQNHLDEIVDIFKINRLGLNKIIEIGCGKGYFLQKLWDCGLDAVGFDPAYDGDDERIVKEYFTNKYSGLNSELIVLRHTLEHIAKPFDFLQTIAAATSNKSKIYIEVPSFEWIQNNGAFWDIFYEHCNYFTKDVLMSFFKTCVHGYTFGGQYQYVIGDLSELCEAFDFENENADINLDLTTNLNKYKELISQMQNICVWGAGAKGATFVNLVDPHRKHVDYVVDINYKKQNMYIGGSGHKIIPPSQIDYDKCGNIIIMNGNYKTEIQNMVNDKVKMHIMGVENE